MDQGIGAVLSPDGSEHPVCYYSQKLLLHGRKRMFDYQKLLFKPFGYTSSGEPRTIDHWSGFTA